MKYPKHTLKIEVNGATIRSCKGKAGSSEDQTRSMPGVGAASGTTPSSVARVLAGGAEKPGQMVENPGSADTHNLLQGENSVSRSDEVINCVTSGPETKTQFKPKSRRGKRKRSKKCDLPEKQANGEVVKDSEGRKIPPRFNCHRI